MTAIHATLAYCGRILWLDPFELGALFEDACTVQLKESEAPCFANGFKRRQVTNPQKEFWYDVQPSLARKVFFTHAGFGPRIEKKLREFGHNVTVHDFVPNELEEPVFNSLRGVTFRGSQQEVLTSMLAERGGVVDCPTGWGKSHLIRLIAGLYPKASIVITVPRIDVAREIYNSLSQFVPNLGMVGDGRRDPQRVTVAVSHSLGYCNPNANLLLADEAHALCSSSFREMLVQFRRAKMLAFTATAEGRHDNGDAYLEAIFGPVIASVPYQEAVDSGNVVPITVLKFDVNSGPNVSKISKDDVRSREGLWANAQRNERIRESVRYIERFATTELHNPDPQILIMCDKTEHAFRLGQLLPEFTVVHGDLGADDVQRLTDSGALLPAQKICTPKLRKAYKQQFSDGSLRRVISTFVWAQGVNFLDLDFLVRADGLASPIQAGQVPGRLSRLGSDGQKGRGYLVDFFDRFSPDLANRSRKRFASYSEKGWEIRAAA